MTLKADTRFYVALAITIVVLGFVNYGIERSQFILLYSGIAALFVLYGYLLYYFFSEEKSTASQGIGIALFLRLILLFAIPNLSDDFYRFIWDGNLFISGINPFAHLPSVLHLGNEGFFLSDELYEGLNSKEYYTVYPPVSQFIYALGAWMFGEALLGNIIVMRVFIIAAEAGSLWLLKNLLQQYGLNPKYLLIYALNPLIVMELTGNLHFEGVMIFFLLLAFYLVRKEWYLLAFVSFTLSVNTKLIPLILTPYLVFSLGWKRTLQLTLTGIACTVLLHLPFIDRQFIANFSDSLNLYFQSFEFNASIYYLVRWVGFQVEGYNIIATAGPRLAAAGTLLIIIVSWFCRNAKLKNLPSVYIIIMTIYYLFSTTVHPWYLSSLLVFVPFAGYNYPVVWSLLIPLTYITYQTTAYEQNFWLITLEYLVVLAVVMVDFYRRNRSVPEKFSFITQISNTR